MRSVRFREDDAELEVAYWQRRDGRLTGTADGAPFEAVLHGWEPPRLDLELDGARGTVTVTRDGAAVWVDGPDGEQRLVTLPRFPVAEHEVPTGGLTAPMNGTVVVVEVAEGDRVQQGQTVMVIEAMKMEHRVTAPFDGTITELMVDAGAVVATDALLAVVSEDGTGEDESEGDELVVTTGETP